MPETIYRNKIVSFKRDKSNGIIFINTLGDQFSDDDIKEYHDAYIKIYERYEKKNKKIFLIFDLTALGMNAISFSKIEGQFLKNIEHRTKKVAHAICVITGSTLIKSSVNAMIKLFGTCVPTKIVYDIESAINYFNSLDTGKIIEYHTN